MPARGQRPGAPGRSIAVSGSQRSFLGLAYIGRLDRQSILMKSTAHVRAFNKPQVNPVPKIGTRIYLRCSCLVKSPSSDISIILMRAPELLAEVAVRPPAGGHAMSKGHAYSQCPATSTTQCCPSSSCRRATSGTSYWGTTAWNPGRSSCTADPSVNNMSKPQTPQDRERGDELTARVFAPGRSILSTMGAIL